MLAAIALAKSVTVTFVQIRSLPLARRFSSAASSKVTTAPQTSKRESGKGCSEKAALSNLESWLAATTRELLIVGRGLQPPADADMPAFKEPDNTADAGGNDW